MYVKMYFPNCEQLKTIRYNIWWFLFMHMKWYTYFSKCIKLKFIYYYWFNLSKHYFLKLDKTETWNSHYSCNNLPFINNRVEGFFYYNCAELLCSYIFKTWNILNIENGGFGTRLEVMSMCTSSSISPLPPTFPLSPTPPDSPVR